MDNIFFYYAYCALVCVCIHTIRSIRSYTYCRKRHLYIILIYYARILERFPSTNVVHATPVVRNIAVAGRPHLHTDFPGTFSAGDRTALVLSLCCKKGFSYVPKLSKSLQAQPYRESTLILFNATIKNVHSFEPEMPVDAEERE